METSNGKQADKVYNNCSNPDYAKDMSFQTRYAYGDTFSALISEHIKPEEQLLLNQMPDITPSRQRYETGTPKQPIRTQTEEIMGDTKPHNLLQGQAGCLGTEPAPYSRQVFTSEPVASFNKLPEFTPWQQRYDMGIPEPPTRSQTERIMEDTEPHNLLQDQAGYLGSGPAPYPRQVYQPGQQSFNTLPKFTPYEMGIPELSTRNQTEGIMENTEQHNLLQDQTSYMKSGPAAYPRQVYEPRQQPYFNTLPEFTPWRQRYEMGIPEPPNRDQTELVMEDTEPHNLLQDQAGYLGSGPAPYPRQEFKPGQEPSFNKLPELRNPESTTRSQTEPPNYPQDQTGNRGSGPAPHHRQEFIPGQPPPSDKLPEFTPWRQHCMSRIPVPEIRSGRLPILYSYIPVFNRIYVVPIMILVRKVDDNLRIPMKILKPLNNAEECWRHHKEWCCEDGENCVFEAAEKM